MNRLVTAIKSFDELSVRELIKNPKWASWQEPSGKNALHYLCGVPVIDATSSEASLRILKLLLRSGLHINSVHRIEEKNCNFFPATPLWYAYTRGRNEKPARKLAESKGPRRLLSLLNRH